MHIDLHSSEGNERLQHLVLSIMTKGVPCVERDKSTRVDDASSTQAKDRNTLLPNQKRKRKRKPRKRIRKLGSDAPEGSFRTVPYNLSTTRAEQYRE